MAVKKKKYAKKPNGKAATGRPSKKDSIHYEGLKLCYSKGFTDKETALALQITDRTLENWKALDPEFFQTLNDWKSSADALVEKSLYERACGYSHPETKAQWVESDQQDESGEWRHPGRWEYAELTKHYPPDPTSMIFWLKNRQPGKWREKQEIDIGGTVKAEISDEDRAAFKAMARALARKAAKG